MQKIYSKIAALIAVMLLSFTSMALTVSITPSQTSGCAPLSVGFHSTTSPGVTYTWTIIGSAPSHEDSASHIFTAAGIYTVSLTVDSAGHSASDAVVITVNPKPTINFAVNDTDICPGVTVTFTDLSTPGASGPLRHGWDFGDGGPTSSSSSHAYPTPGYYSITLIDTNSNGCINDGTMTHYVHVYTKPNVYAYDGYPSQFCNAPATTMLDQSTGGEGPLTYLWRFGDGTTGTASSLNHTYAHPGIYYPKSIVTDVHGCVDSDAVNDPIVVNSTGFKFDTNICLKTPETFIDTSRGARNSVTWTFGDGSAVSHADTVVTHTYNAPGVYNVNLAIVYQYYGSTTFTCNVAHTVTITPFSDTFTITPAHPCPEQDTLRYNGITHYGDTIRWQFGDHGTASGDTVSHIFYPGALDSVFHHEGCTPYTTYILNRTAMYITDRHGCRDTVRRIDTTYNMLFDIVPTKYGGCVSLTDTFRVSTLTSVPYRFPAVPYPYATATYLWNFGDGSATSTSSTPVHTFTAVGSYSVTCTITTVNGCTFKDTVTVTVGNHPVITWHPLTSPSFCYGNPLGNMVVLAADMGLSSVTIDHLVWDYGDGTKDSIGVETIVSHSFVRAGNLPVKLTAYNLGCPATFTDTIRVHPPQSIIGVDYNCRHSDSFLLHNVSLGATSSVWLLPGTSTSLTNVNFVTDTTVVIRLATYNSTWGCSDTASFTLIPLSASAHFAVSDTTLCSPDLIYFASGVDFSDHIFKYSWFLNRQLVHADSAIAGCPGIVYPDSSSFSDSITHVGIDTMSLVVTDIHGCVDTFTRHIYFSKLDAAFKATPQRGCWPLHVTFTDTSVHSVFAPVDSVIWTFGDGGTAFSDTTFASHVYTTNSDYVPFDTFTVRAVVINSFGCRDTLVKPAYITEMHPHADFGTRQFCSHSATDLQDPANFSNTTTIWNFGNGVRDTTTGNLVFYTYPIAGTYTVTAIAIDSIGCRDTFSSAILATDPQAQFSMSDTFLICSPYTVNFRDLSTLWPGGDTGAWFYTYAWDFGDGSNSPFRNPTHTYNSTTTGDITVTLTVTTSFMCSGTIHHVLHFMNDTGGFTYPGMGCSPLVEHFMPTLGYVDSIKWEFGDLTTQVALSSDTVSHVYLHPGAYVPQMVIYKHGCHIISHGIDTVKVDSVHAAFNFSPNPVCPYTPVTFHDVSSSIFSPVNSWHWSFSPTATTASPTYVVGGSGPVMVTLTASTAWNCSDTETHAVTVYPHGLSAGAPVVVCYGGSRTLTASGGTGYHWYPSTGLSCTTCASPNAHPLVTTTYTVTGTNGYGCADTATVTATVDIATLSIATSPTNYVCYGQTVSLTANPGSSTYTSYTWSPAGTLSATSGSTVVASPTVTTIYAVSGVDIYGCTGSTNTLITVYSLPTVTATATPSTLCPGGSSTLTASGAVSYSWLPSGSLSPATGTPVIATPATTTIYTVTGTDAHGCQSKATTTVTVYSRPDIILIGNTGPSCNGENILLYDTITGGTPGYTYGWTGPGSYTSAAHNPLLTSVTTAMNGWYVLTVTDAHGCSRKDSTYVSSYVLTPFTITGDTAYCIGGSTTLTASPSSGLSFSWSPSGSLSCSTCAVTNAHPTTTTTYTVTETDGHGCAFTRIKTVIVYPLPVIPPIQGERSLCVNQWAEISDSVTGGTWTASGNVGLMSPIYGFAQGVSAGTGIVTYTYTDIHGCTNSDTFLITVHPLPVVPPIMGDSMVCLGGTAVYTDSITGGYWGTNDDEINLVDSSGHLTTVDTGYGGVVYFYTDTFGCQTAIDMEVYIAPSPVLAGIMADTVCLHDSAFVATSLPGGTWTIGDPSIAVVSTSGYIIGHAAGTTMITYTVTNAYGCSAEVHNFFTVMAIPDTGILNVPDSICLNTSTSVGSSAGGGFWTSSDTSIAIIDSFGNLSGVDTGYVTLTYTVTNWHCSNYATHTTHVITAPYVPAISGENIMCLGGVITLSDALPGGYWVSADESIVTVDSFGGVTGVGTGTTFIGYVVVNMCGRGYAIDTITVVPPTPPITGVAAVCSGSTTTLANIVPGGTWSSSNTDVATVDPATGVVTGVGYGTTTITYTATSPCGLFTVTVNVMVDMAPIITTNFLVACQTMSDGGGVSSKGVAMGAPSSGEPGPVIDEGDGCLLVCENKTVRYFAHGVANSHFTWTCMGGTIVNTYGDNADSIDVLWSTVGIVGNITVTDTFSHCIGEATLCVRVISKPHAEFTSSTTGVCLGDGIAFFDASVADTLSPIAGWYWDFGDGTSFGDQYPPTHVYGAPGVYYVTLVVWNACHCADSFKIKVYVDENPGPQIHCPAIVCEKEIATYSIDDPCDPEWVVTGGEIIDGDGTGTIIVQWDDAPADGHGYVQVTNTCGDCNLPSIVTVPIILSDAPINGPAFVCAGQQYTYSLPLWAGTDYEWGVLGHPGIIIGYNNDHQMTVQFPGPGTYTIHAWYQNRLKLCGGNVTKTVVVKDVATISGVTHICVDAAADYGYSLSGGHTGIWTVINPLGVTTTGTVPYSGTSAYLNVPGVWLINAVGDFCVNPLNVYVEGTPAAIDSVVGDDTVCLNRVYTYRAYNDVPGTTYEWEAIGGNVLPASGSETVDVVWTSPGTKQLRVRHEPDAEPHCDAPVFTFNVIQEVIDPAITGDTAPCSNAHRWYNSHYNRGDAYDWSIYPDSVGSVVANYHSPDARVLWNNVVAPTPAYVIVKAQKCDTAVSDTLRVTVQPPPPVYVTTDTPVICPGTGIILTSHGIADSCIWNFGDGTTAHALGGSIYHLYPNNITSDNIVYNVSVTPILPADPYCPTAGVGFYHITVLPGPLAYILSNDDDVWCPPNDSSAMFGTVTDNIGGLTFQWFRNGAAIPLTDTPDYMAPAGAGISHFHMVVTASNGCTDTSNTISFEANCTVMPGGSHDTLTHHDSTGYLGGSCDMGETTASISHGCNTITLTGSTAGYPTWYAYTPPNPGDGWTNFPLWSRISASSAVAHYDVPGVYRFAYVVNYLPEGVGSGCRDTVYVRDTVGVIASYRTLIRCGPDNSDSVFYSDNSSHLSWWHITDHTWNDGLTPTGTGISFLGIYTAGSTITMTETVSGTESGNPFSCSITKPVHLPARLPHFGYTFSPNNICEGIPVTFTPATTAGVASFLWQFGNDGTNRLVSPNCSYQNDGSSFLLQFTTHMTVTDTIGCIFDTSVGLVNIYDNNLLGTMDPGSVVCPGSTPFSISYSESPLEGFPTSYAWSNGDSTFVPYNDVYNTGAYTVKVYDAHQCRFVPLNVENVKVLRVPTAQIRGRLNYCTNEQINLNGYAGHSVSYQWFVNGDGPMNIDHISFYEYAAGTYTVTLVLSMYDTADAVGPCTDTAVAILHVLPAPDAPGITGPVPVDCDLYHLQLTATASEAGTFNWSNSDFGPVADVYTGGAVSVRFTNMAGCSSYAQTVVPAAPSYYFQYLPSGCYDICKDRFPITLYGPPHVPFDSWEWRKDGDVESSGTGVMDPYVVPGTGEYQWVLGNGLCDQKSNPLDITKIACDNCDKINVDVKRIECNSGDPVTYTIYINLVDPYSGDTYTVGTDGGPLMPFSGTITSTSTLLTLSLAVIDTDATTVTVYVELTHHDGTKCLYKKVVHLPDCSWIAEKPIADTSKANQLTVSTAMLVYPNPATQMVTISYDYGDQPFSERSIAVFDQLGRRTQSLQVIDSHGNWPLNTNDWTPGVYIIRMEGDGKALQTQRLIVNN